MRIEKADLQICFNKPCTDEPLHPLNVRDPDNSLTWIYTDDDTILHEDDKIYYNVHVHDTPVDDVYKNFKLVTAG